MPIPSPVVLLDARARYAHPGFEVARASRRSVWLPNENARVEVPVNALGWEVDPATGEALGVRLERQRTNLFPHSNQLDAAGWSPVNIIPPFLSGAAGGWWRMEAASSGSMQRGLGRGGIAAQAGKVYAFSFDVQPDQVPGMLVRLAGGFGTGDLRIYADADGFQVASGDSEPSSLLATDILRLRNGALRFCLAVEAQATSATSLTLYLKNSFGTGIASQLNAGDGLWLRALQGEEIDPGAGDIPMSTSYIETDASTAMRAADSAVFPNIAAQTWFNGTMGALVAEVMVPPPLQGVRPVAVFAAGSNDGISLRAFGSTWNFLSRGPTLFESINFGSVRQGLNRLGFAFDLRAGVAHCVSNGGAAVSGPAADPTVAMMALHLGRNGISGSHSSSRALNGCVRRLVYYPAPLAAATLQSLTAIQE